MTPSTVRCSSCNVALRVPENAAGKSIRCPKCGTAVTVQTEETRKAEARPAFEVVEPEAETEEDDGRPVPLQLEKEEKPPGLVAEPERDTKPARKKRRRPAAAEGMAGAGTSNPWKKVRLGVTLLLVGVALALLSIIAAQFLPLFMSSFGSLRIVIRASLVLMTVQAALSLGGAILLAFTPRSHAPRTLIHICIGLTALMQVSSLGTTAWAFSALSEMVPTAEESTEHPPKSADETLSEARSLLDRAERILFWAQIIGLLGSIEAILFPLFLRELASSLQKPELMLLCETIIKLTVASIALSWIPIGIMRLGIPLGFLMGVFQFVSVVGALIGIGRDVAFIMLYVGLREAIQPLARARKRKPRPE